MSKSQSKFITSYGPKTRVQISFTGSGRTKQSFKAECDVNNIMARFQKTGVLDFTARNQPRYADVTGMDFTEAMHTVARAKGLFHELPAHIRDRFKNSPEAFLDFVNNPNNRDEARELGLLKPEQPAVKASLEGAAAEKPVDGPGVSERVQEPGGDVKVRQEA